MQKKLRNKKLIAILIIFFLILSFIFAPCISRLYKEKSVSSVDIEAKFNTEQLVSDLEYLIKTALEIHPDLYSNYPKPEFDKDVEEVRRQITAPLTRKEFFLKITPLISKIDGHSNVYTPQKEVEEYLGNDGKLFPYDVFLTEEKIFISKDYTSNQKIPLGSEIMSINNIPSKDIITSLLKYESRETLPAKLAELQVRFKTRLWLIFNFENEFVLEYRAKDSNETSKESIIGVTQKTIDSNNPKPPVYSYKVLDNKTALVMINSFSNSSSYEKFLKDTFTQIQKENIETIIIDLRNNGGGDYRNAAKLINYISDKEYKLIEKQEIRASKQVKKYIKENNFPCFLCNLPVENFDEFTNKVWDTRDGNIALFEYKDQPQSQNYLRFEGKAYVATSSFTYSAAAIFANTVKQSDIGTIIGQPTGGLGVFYSDPYKFKLPNTKLDVGISYRKFYLPNGKQEPVSPNIPIETKLEDITNQVDPILGYINKN